MAPRNKNRRTATALVAVSMIGGLHARPASAAPPGPAPDDRALSHSIELWLDERFGDPWQARTQDRGVRRYDIAEGPLEAVIYGGYAFMSSRIRASNAAGELDNDLTLTPRHTFNVWTTFRLPWETTIGGGVQFMDLAFRNTLNTTEVPSYRVLNAMATREVTRHLTLRFNANNLADARYVDRVGGGHFIPGAGRSASLTAGFRF